MQFFTAKTIFVNNVVIIHNVSVANIILGASVSFGPHTLHHILRDVVFTAQLSLLSFNVFLHEENEQFNIFPLKGKPRSE